jgi:hypothetical protein
MSNWFKRLFGGSDDSSTSEAPEPATAPEPAAASAEPSVAPAEPASEPETSAEGVSDAGDEPA